MFEYVLRCEQYISDFAFCRVEKIRRLASWNFRWHFFTEMYLQFNHIQRTFFTKLFVSKNHMMPKWCQSTQNKKVDLARNRKSLSQKRKKYDISVTILGRFWYVFLKFFSKTCPKYLRSFWAISQFVVGKDENLRPKIIIRHTSFECDYWDNHHKGKLHK